MRAIKIDVVKETVEEIEISGSLDSMYAALQCDCICSVGIHLTPCEVLWVDDEGLLKDPIGAFTIVGYPNPLSGHGIILGVTSSGANRSTKYSADLVRRMVEFTDPKYLPKPEIKVISFNEDNRPAFNTH